MSIEIPINVNMEVEESQMAFDMKVDEEINVTVIQGTDVSDTTAVEADVLSGKKFHKADGSLATGIHSGSSYVKIGEVDVSTSSSSTTATLVGSFTVDTPSELWTSAKLIFVSVRDKAGKRNGYFYGTDAWFSNPIPVNQGTANAFTVPARLIYACDSDGKMLVNSSNYGVYPYDVGRTGTIRIYVRYQSSYTLTINGTYHVEVYALSWPDSSPLT